MADEKLFTSYRWPDNIFKPVLYPICTAAGTEITRGFPLNPKTGDRIDHYHHVGMWLNYGNVNGNDFWTNGSEGLGIKNNNGGVIEHLSVDKISEGRGEGLMYTTSSWFDVSGEEIIKEFTEYHFIAKGRIRIIDRITTLKAVNKGVSMPDTKEGMFGIRVCGQLELPATGEITVLGPDGQPVKINATTLKDKISGDGLSEQRRHNRA